jgi:hypothetical protein
MVRYFPGRVVTDATPAASSPLESRSLPSHGVLLAAARGSAVWNCGWETAVCVWVGRTAGMGQAGKVAIGEKSISFLTETLSKLLFFLLHSLFTISTSKNI